MMSRILKIVGLFCKRSLSNRLYSAKETYNFKEPTNRSHPICKYTYTFCTHLQICSLVPRARTHTEIDFSTTSRTFYTYFQTMHIHKHKLCVLVHVHVSMLHTRRDTTHCTTLQHTATHCSTLQHTATQHTATHLQHTAPR